MARSAMEAADAPEESVDLLGLEVTPPLRPFPNAAEDIDPPDVPPPVPPPEHLPVRPETEAFLLGADLPQPDDEDAHGDDQGSPQSSGPYPTHSEMGYFSSDDERAAYFPGPYPGGPWYP